MKAIFPALITMLLLCPSSTNAQWHGPNAPDSLSFQGRLTDLAGVPVTDGNYAITFAMYKGASKIWEQAHATVPVTDGVFNVILSGTVTWPLDTVAFNEPIDLGIKVGANSEMTPRTPLTSAAYALGMRGMYAVWADDGTNKAPNLIGGASNNFVADNVAGATISGGGGWAGSLARADSILGDWGTIGGGERNATEAYAATIGGGSINAARANYATVSGGAQNTAGGSSSTVSGGGGNTASNSASTVGGGIENDATGSSSTVGGGSGNAASADGSSVGGGYQNEALAYSSTVGGGFGNTAGGGASTVGGGNANEAAGYSSTVGGGNENAANGYYSTVPGGRSNKATRGYTFAAGQASQANHSGTFVWADSANSSGTVFASTDENQFLIRARGGVGIGTNAPANLLSVTGSADISGSLGIGTDSPARLLHLRGSNAVIRIDREEGSGATSLLIHQYDGGTPDVPWKSFAVNVDASGVDNGTFKIQDLHAAVGGGGTIHDRLTIANNGDVTIPGNLSKGGGSFKIDHPLDPENKYLFHSFVESPDMKNVYDGTVALDESGAATIELPDYFETLNRDFRYQLTCIGGFAPVYVAEKVSGNRFSIAGGTPGMEVSWQITGIRKDPYAEHHRIQVEVDKPVSERGTYLHPESYTGTK